MPFPDGTPTVTLEGTLPAAATGTGYAGQVVCRPSAHLIDEARHAVYPGGGKAAIVNGEFSIELLPTDAAGIEPEGWRWYVDVQPTGGSRLAFWAEIEGADGATIQLADLVAVPAPGGGPGPGPAGASAYEIAVNEGFEGTVGEWLASLVGPAGADGDDGAPGTQGPQGVQGIQGPPGAAGAQGPQGDPGPAGDNGATGAQGPQGPEGPQGDTGPEGPQPELGAAGAGADIALRSTDPTTTNARTPTAHAASHAAAGSDPVTLTQAQITGLAAALAAKVAGGGASTDNTVPRFDGTTGLLLQNSTVLVEDDGSVTITGNLTDAGNFVVRDSNTAATKGYRFRTSGGNLDTESGGADWFWSTFPNADFTGTQNNYFRMESGTALLHVCAETQFNDGPFGGRVHTLNGVANTLGFHGATPVAKQSVTGSRGGNAALASLLTALDTLGVIDDNTTA